MSRNRKKRQSGRSKRNLTAVRVTLVCERYLEPIVRRWIQVPFVFILLLTLNFSLFTSQAAAQLENGMAAEVVIGQPNFFSESTALSQAGMNQPVDLHFDGQRLFVAEFSNRRILIWNDLPKRNGQPADVVVGQPDFQTNSNGVTQSKFRITGGVFSDGQRLFVSDRDNHRLLIYHTIPTENFEPADVVVGQPNFTTRVSAVSRTQLTNPQGIFSDGTRLILADVFNNRVLIWNKIPTTNGAPADIVIGQTDFDTNTSGTSRTKMNLPSGITSDGKKLIVGEFNNHRVLIWNTIPTQNGQPADVVLGQPDFETNVAGTTRNRFRVPMGVFTDGKKLFINDRNNHRILVYRKIPTVNFAPADLVIGQTDFTSRVNKLGPDGLRNPNVGIFFGQNRLFVTDTFQHRVLIYNIGESIGNDLGPQFSQGKAVVGKVFIDWNENGRQDK